LRDRPAAEVLAAVKAWVAKLNSGEQDYDRLICEALWVQQGHHAVDAELLKKALRLPTGDARAAATRILADELDHFPNAVELLKVQAGDDFARTRVEAVRALSFIPEKAAVEAALVAAEKPRDYWTEYTLEATLSALAPVWKPLLQQNAIATNAPQGLALLNTIDAMSKPGGASVGALRRLLSGGEMPEKARKSAIAEVAKAKGDAAKGHAIYSRICFACHKVGNEGIAYGPDLDEVGTRLKRDEIIESILDPNAAIDPKFLTTNITAGDGHALTGFVTAETADSVTLRLAGGVTQQLKKSDIKKREALKQSSMPEGLGGTMAPAEFFDLIEYLSSLKGGKK
jgi:putative heme-binding domain-containing protein